MVIIQLKHQQKASQILRQKYSITIHSLEKRLNEINDPTDKEYKKVQTLYSGLIKYCDQLVIIGFNSQKYDIPLIRRYLPSSLHRLDSHPSFVIKKNRSYMAIATKNLKYLDLCNYLAAGTSLVDFYKSYDVDTAKGFLPYQWFDTLDKLNYPCLPTQDEFYSILTNSTISKENYQLCEQAWEEENMTTFSDYLRYYNNHDVIGMVQGIEKMLEIENKNGLDVFKDSVSLPGLTQKYLFKNLDKSDYFVGIGKEHAHIYKELRQFGIVGGPSIIYHRYHEVGKTKIKGKHTCRNITGFDANSLYLSCTAKDMPTGKYILREKSNGFKKQTSYSKQSIQWLNYLIKENGINIRHAENYPHQEKQIENYSVDGYCEETNTVYEFYGCYYHGHDCSEKHNTEKWKKTKEREEEIRALGYNLETITSCKWLENPASKIWYRSDNIECTFKDVEKAVISGESFGIIKCSLEVPDYLINHFSEFPPIFKNTEITIADIGEHMQEYCRSITRKLGVKRSLISSMTGKNLVILTPLFKKYLEMGIVCTDIDWIMEYNPKPVFKWFQDEVVHDRRMADLDPNYNIRGQTSKTKGNCAYGRTIINKFRHTSVSFTTEEKIANHIKNPLFKCFDELNNGLYEVEKQKKKVVLDTPIQIGIAVYAYAKLSLISCWEFINKYLVNDFYQLMECDTDSLYIAFARDSIDDCVKPDLKDDWFKEKWNYFSSEDPSLISFEGYTIPFRQWDKRTPGKYKPEFEGTGMICLNSKVYHIWGVDKNGKEKTKTSTKGTQKRNELIKADFLKILNTQKPRTIENAGFILDGQIIKTYKQKKRGLEYFYAKRKVLEDGISTTHLDI